MERTTSGGKTAELLFWVILLSFAAYAAVFLGKASFVVDDTRYFSLFDDAMISMQYARNFANGDGLVWMAGGPRVEGFSNPLWVFYMAAWHALPIDAAKISLAIQLTGLSLSVLSLFLVRRIAASLSGGDPRAWLPAVVLTASYLPLQLWAWRGMETSVISAAILFAVFVLVDPGGRRWDDWPLWAVLGAGVLVRLDFGLCYAGIVGYLLASRRRQWRRTLLRSATVLALILLVGTVLRYAYYGELLPNTWYLKLWGIPLSMRWHAGAWMTLEFVRTMTPVVFILPFVYHLLRPRDGAAWLMTVLFALQILYNIHVGGDSWEWWGHGANRFVVVAMPLFFILTALTLRRGTIGLEKVRVPRPARWLFLSAAVLGTVVLLHGGLHGRLFHDLVRADGLHVRNDEAQVRYALNLRWITAPDATIATPWAGAIPYFSRRPAVDPLGKNDHRIARIVPAILSYEDVYPGHNKFDYAYSIGSLKPDVVTHSYHDEDDIYLSTDYWTFLITDPRVAAKTNEACYLRKDSTKVLWDAVGKAAWIRPRSWKP